MCQICVQNFRIDELFLVLVSRRYKTHICVMLNNGGTWSTTPWIKQCDCNLCFMCCSNGKEMPYKYYVPTTGNQIPSGTDDTSTTKLKGPDTSLYEQELANFVSKSKDGKGIAVPKKRQLKIDTAFMSKKPKQQHRLGSYPVTAKCPTSSKETSGKSNSQCE